MTAHCDGKVCPKCSSPRGCEDFHRNRARSDGHATWCRPCLKVYSAEYNRRPEVRERVAKQALARYHALPPDKKLLIQQGRYHKARNLELQYGLTLDAYDAMLASQDGGCAICGTPPSERRLCVDHDHACCPGKRTCGQCVRGLLCVTCNVWLGFYENKDWIARADRYVNREIARRERDA